MNLALLIPPCVEIYKMRNASIVQFDAQILIQLHASDVQNGKSIQTYPRKRGKKRHGATHQALPSEDTRGRQTTQSMKSQNKLPRHSQAKNTTPHVAARKDRLTRGVRHQTRPDSRSSVAHAARVQLSHLSWIRLSTLRHSRGTCKN